MNGMILYPTDDECMVLNLIIFSQQWEEMRKEARSVMESDGTRHLIDLIWETGWLLVLNSYTRYLPLKINELVLG